MDGVDRIALIVGAVLACAPATSGWAVEPDRGVEWLKKPTPNDLLAVYPRKALREGIAGSASVTCIATLQGTLRGCRVNSEDPPGKGFGEAALILTRQFQMRPAIRGGVPVEGPITIPIKWKRPDPGIYDSISRNDPRLGSRLRDESPETRNANVVVSGLVWTKAPTVANVLAAYPPKAREEHLSGRVTLNCALNRTGGLSSCESIIENPRGRGFARAARRLAEKFVAPTTVGNGQSIVGASTQLNFAFAAETLSSPAPVIGKPRWVALPEPSDFNNAFPASANKAGVLQAKVVLSCAVIDAGALTGCKTESEEPSGYGFGAAAIGIANKFRLAIWTDEGLPAVGGTVRVPIRYDLHQEPKPAQPAASAKP